MTNGVGRIIEYPMRKGLPPLPLKMAHLRISEKGYPIPFFVAFIDGKPDFRVIDPEKMKKCGRDNLCWLCGQKLGQFKAFVSGPLFIVARTSSEPPSHVECAQFAVRACPFMVLPEAQYREARLPEGVTPPAGHLNKRNPGVTCIWVTRHFKPYRSRSGGLGILFHCADEPEDIEWFREGRYATRAEVAISLKEGMPHLERLALQDGPNETLKLQKVYQASLKYLPLTTNPNHNHNHDPQEY